MNESQLSDNPREAMFMKREIFKANTPHKRNSMVWFCLSLFFESVSLPYVPIPSNNGEHNKEAVEVFQQLMCLKVDGIMGNNSLEALAWFMVNMVPPFNGKEPSW